MPVNTFVLLRTEGVTAVIDLTDGRLPSIPYWGADLGELSESEVAAIARSNEFPTASNIVDDPVHLAVLPEHWTGWLGRPGLSGSRSGRDWSPKFSTTALRVDGDDRSADSARADRHRRAHRDRGRRGRRGRRSGRHSHPRSDRRGTAAGPGGRDQHRCGRLRAAGSDPRLPGAAGGPRGAGHVRSLGQGADRPAQPAAGGHPPPGEPQGPYGRRRGDRAAPRHPRASPSSRARSGPSTPAGAATTCTTPSSCPRVSR